MARPMRIQFPDAWYHVINRGKRGEHIFTDQEDYPAFIDLLKECVEMWNIRVVAYCLMETHYHILLQTPDANLSRCMRHIDGVYTQFFNRTHGLDRQLFRGRYKFILIDSDSFSSLSYSGIFIGILSKPEWLIVLGVHRSPWQNDPPFFGQEKTRGDF